MIIRLLTPEKMIVEGFLPYMGVTVIRVFHFLNFSLITNIINEKLFTGTLNKNQNKTKLYN